MSAAKEDIDEVVEVRGTQTHHSDAGAREMVLIAVDSENVGKENTYPPPNPYNNDLGVEMRQGYFIHGNAIVVQFPRRSDEYPRVDKKLELEDICLDEGTVYAYYPINKNHALQITWNYQVDEWEMTEKKFDTGYVEEVGALHRHPVWENRRNL